jgi:hypothetical protein
MKIDPYNHERRYKNWKKNVLKAGIKRVSKENERLIIDYVFDMENGLNVASGSVKGGRSYIRLNTLIEKTIFFSRRFKERFDIDDISKISEEQLLLFFTQMKNGEVLRNDGKKYIGVANFVKLFKSFWHWYQKVNRKKGIEIKDITLDLDTKQNKPKWVYLNEEQVKRLCSNAKFDYRVLFMFLFDTGIRSPTELMNVRVSDFFNDYKELQIREEVSKTFGRRIKLMLCSDLIKDYIKLKELGPTDFVFEIKPSSVNKYLKRLSTKSFGDKESEAGAKYSEMTMYDFRHISCCYWLPRYKSESALKYRFGWKKSDKIHYYSELLGMKDTIQEDDMLVDVTKTEIEKKLDKTEKEKEILQDRLGAIEKQMQELLGRIGTMNVTC